MYARYECVCLCIRVHQEDGFQGQAVFSLMMSQEKVPEGSEGSASQTANFSLMY